MSEKTKSDFIKFRISEQEKNEFRKLAENQNIPISKLILLMKNSYVASDSYTNQELINTIKLPLSNIMFYINQFKSDINPEQAIENIEKEVNTLCHIFI